MVYHYLFKKTVLLLFFLLAGFCASAQIIRGKIIDSKTGESLTGATVQLQQDSKKLFAPVNLDGSYIFRNVAPGTYQLQVKFIGYRTSKEYAVEAKQGVTVLNVSLTDDNTALTEISVTEHANKETDRAARGLEKNAPSIENILSANTIQLLPDVTVGNALQRVSGVTIQRTSTGDGRYAIIRGMDQRYNNTLINGIKIPSPDNQYRFVPMDIFPSEMLERLEVIKALTPSMEGDAIGGTMNLVMKSAPDRFYVSANASGGASTLFSSSRPFQSFSSAGINKQSPAEINGNNYNATNADFNTSALNYTNKSTPINSTAGLTIGDRFFNNKLGVIFSGSYQNIYRGSNSQLLFPNAQPNASPANSPQFSDSYTRQYSTQTERLGLMGRIDYVFDKRNKISFFNLYVNSSEYITRISQDTTGLGLNSTQTNKQIDIEYLSQYTRQTIYNGTLQGEHLLKDNLKFTWSGVYSIAKRDVPDRTSFTFVDETPGSLPGVKRDSNNVKISHIWEHNSDKDISGYANLIYTPKIADRAVELSAGGLVRHKSREDYYNPYSLAATSGVLYHNNISAIPFSFMPASNGSGNYTTVSPDDYNLVENVNDEYLQVKFNLIDKLQLLGGARIENTVDMYNCYLLPVTYSQKNGYISYTDVLPSAHLKYALNDITNLRLSYFASINRPGFGEIVPYNLPGDYFNTIGNPLLQHARASNYDFRYELFPGGSDQLLLGAFYKKIINPIELFVTRDGGPSAQYLQPQNAPNPATNFGAEAVVSKFFGVFGISANYTFTHSRITTSKISYSYGPNGATQAPVDQTRPLQGQADNIGNVSFLFKSQKIGLNMQLAFVYTGERIAIVSPYYNLDYWNHALGQLDFSFEKTIGGHFSVYGKVNNLTNAANTVFLKYPHQSVQNLQQEFLGNQPNANETQVQNDIYKVSFLTGIRYKF